MDQRFPINNAFPDCPANIADGRAFNPSARGKGVEDAYIREINGINNLYVYSNFLQHNGIKMFNDAGPKYPNCGTKVCFFDSSTNIATTPYLVSLSYKNYETYRKTGEGPRCKYLDKRGIITQNMGSN